MAGMKRVHDHEDGTGKSPKKQKSKSSPKEKTETRLRRFRRKAPGTYLERLNRVRTQRIFLVNRNRTTGADGCEEERFDIAGSTGNLYHVIINKIPSCSCPDALNGNQCKHIIHVMVNVLKAREDLAYQLALLSSELAEIFGNAPASALSREDDDKNLSTGTGGTRKPIEGDCPVCVMPFEAGEDIIWCKAACGNNIHRQCFEQWAKSKAAQVKCVYCRTPWEGDKDFVKKIAKITGNVGADGYVNVASELGISRERDTSTYHQYWVRRTYGD